MRDEPVTEAELHAWLDGELPPERLAAVAAHLTAHPEDRARFDSYRAQAALIRSTFAPLADPAFVSAAAMAPPPAPRRRWRAVAAALVLFAAGTGSGWLLRGIDAPGGGSAGAPPVAAAVAEALAAHVIFAADQRHPVEVGAEQEAHLVAWLSRRLGVRLTAPQLGAAGFELIGGRLLPTRDGPAAQFMYQDAAGRRVTLHVTVRGESGDTAFRFAREGQVSAFFWKERGLAWTLVGDMERPALLDLAVRVNTALQL